MNPGERPDYGSVTESAGSLLTSEALAMIQSRYAYAAALAKGKRVLELGCAAGEGLPLVGEGAAVAVGGDVDFALLTRAMKHHGGRFGFVQLSAEDLPFPDGSFDVVLFFEATYYVPDMGRAFDEITRVLCDSGTVVFVNANPERPDFIPSPYSHHYHTAAEFRSVLSEHGFEVLVEGAFPMENGLLALLVRFLRRALRRAGLVPNTLRGRATLKRFLYRNLSELPAEVPAPTGAPTRRTPLEGDGPHGGYKVIYVTGRGKQ